MCQAPLLFQTTPHCRHGVELFRRAPNPERQRLAVEATVTFLGVTYTIGRLMYQVFGTPAEAEELRQWLGPRIVVVTVVAGCGLIVGGWQALQNAVILRPSLFVGVVLLAIATWDGWRALRPTTRTQSRIPSFAGRSEEQPTGKRGEGSDSGRPACPMEPCELVALARAEAAAHNQDFVGTQHLLLALVRLGGQSAAGQLLAAAGASEEKVRTSLAPHLESTGGTFSEGERPLTPTVLRALESAESVAQACGSARTEPEDVLLILLSDRDGVVVETLTKLGVNIDRLGESLAALPRSRTS